MKFIFIISLLALNVAQAQIKIKKPYISEIEFFIAPNHSRPDNVKNSYLSYVKNDTLYQNKKKVTHRHAFNTGLLIYKNLNENKTIQFNTGLVFSMKQFDEEFGPFNENANWIHSIKKYDLEIPLLISRKIQLGMFKIQPTVGVIPGILLKSRKTYIDVYLDGTVNSTTINYKRGHLFDRFNLFAGLGIGMKLNKKYEIGIQPNVRFNIIDFYTIRDSKKNKNGGMYQYFGDNQDHIISHSLQFSVLRKF